jgi:S1-C subfamily serine protease
MALLPPIFIDCVVAIGIESKNKKSWIGTGFLFGDLFKTKENGRNTYLTYLVTNKHVLKGLDEIIVRFNPHANQPAIDYPLPLTDGNENLVWTGHPDKNIDVAVIQVNVKVLRDEGIKFNYFHSDKHIFTSDQMNDEGLIEGDFVYALGFPMGIVTDRQYVFVRSGIISRIRGLYEKRATDFVVDAFVFPGNSGGPVVSKPESVKINGTKSSLKSRLIGIVKSYLPYKDIAISMQTKKPRITFEENTGLTLVEPVEHIITTVELDKKKKKNAA